MSGGDSARTVLCLAAGMALLPALGAAATPVEIAPGDLGHVAQAHGWPATLAQPEGYPHDVVDAAGDSLWVLDPADSRILRLIVTTRDTLDDHSGTDGTTRAVATQTSVKPGFAVDLPPGLSESIATGRCSLVLRSAGPDAAWLLDRPTARLWHFHDGAWSEPRPLGQHVADFEILDASRLIASTPDHPTRAFAVLDHHGSVVRRLGARIPPLIPELGRATNSWRLGAAPRGGFVAAHQHRPLLRRYDPAGELVWERTVDSPNVVPLERALREAEIEIQEDPEFCCPGNAVIPMATFVMPLGASGFGVRYGTSSVIDLFDLKGSWRGPLRVDQRGGSSAVAGAAATGGIVALADDEGISLFRMVRHLIAGRVVDPGGLGVPDATIEISLGDQVAHRVAADLAGRFHLPAEHRDHVVKLTVAADGFLTRQVTGPLGILLAQAIDLEPSGEICVSVEDHETERPVPEFTVVVARHQTDASSVTRGASTSQSIRDPDGHGCVQPRHGPPWRLAVNADGYAAVEHIVDQLDETLEVTLRPEATLQVSISEPPDEPVAGASVLAEEVSQTRAARVLSEHQQGFSDDLGRLTLRKLAAGEHTVRVEKAGYLPWVGEVTLETGDNPLSIEMDPGAVVRAEVVSNQDRPITGAEVVIRPSGRTVSTRLACTTGSDGRCEVRGVPDGSFQALASAEQHGQARQRVVVPPDLSEVPARFVLQRGVRLEGRVVGTDRYPNTRFEVLVTSPGTTPPKVPVHRDGSFAVDDAPVGSVDLVVLEQGSWSKFAQKRFLIENDGDGADRVEIQLPPPVKLSGRISVEGERCWACTLTASYLGAEAGAPERSTTAFNGQYELLVAIRGRYHVRVQDPDSGSSHAEVLDLVHDESRDFDLGEAFIRGSVVTHLGEAADDAEIQVLAQGRGLVIASTTAAMDGSFRMDSVAPGMVTVTACRGASCAQESVEIRPNAREEVFLELPDEESLSIALVDGIVGSPIQRARFLIVDSTGAAVHLGLRSADPGGVFVLPAVGVPPWTLVVDASGHAVATRFELRPDPHPSTVTLDPRPRSFTVEFDTNLMESCAIQVAGQVGRPIALTGSMPPGAVPFSGPRGMFGRLEPGAYTVTVIPCDGGLPVTKSATLAPGNSPELVFP